MENLKTIRNKIVQRGARYIQRQSSVFLNPRNSLNEIRINIIIASETKKQDKCNKRGNKCGLKTTEWWHE